MILPDFLPKYWLKVVSQPWEGDVTMVLPSMVWQIKKAISNPTPEELHKAVKLVRRLYVEVSPTTVCMREMQTLAVLFQTAFDLRERHGGCMQPVS